MEDANQTQQRPAIWELMSKHTGMVSDATPQARAIGVIITEITQGRATGTMAWREDLVGDSQIGTIASGAVITFVDQICGAACMAALTEPAGFATLDLRIDYLRPSRRGHNLRATAECYRISRHVAFVRAFVFDGESDEDKIAAVQATFMIIKSRKDMLKRRAVENS